MHAASKGVEPRSKTITHGPGTNVALAPEDEERPDEDEEAADEDEEPPVDDASAVATEPRLKVGEGRVVPVATAVVAPAGGAVVAAPLCKRISVAVELTPGRPVPDGMVRILEVEVALRTACAIAISLFLRS